MVALPRASTHDTHSAVAEFLQDAAVEDGLAVRGGFTYSRRELFALTLQTSSGRR